MQNCFLNYTAMSAAPFPTVKKVLLFRIPMSICNFRCHYCYLAQRPVHYQGVQPEMKYSPEQVARALSTERVGGPAFMNFCADGETLLTKDLDKYVKALVQQGHYAEIVTNLSVTNALDKYLAWNKDLLGRVEFKCSFHYLELKKHNLLDRFADNVHKIWAAGASANIEITPTDELIPFIEEVKAYSMREFGALPHLTIARDDRTKGIDYLTHLSQEAYRETWSVFQSEFWEYKRSVFGKKQRRFCYAGAWSLYIDLTTGHARQCYEGKDLGDVFADPDTELPLSPIGRCPIAHCYNAHALLTLGCIPHDNKIHYGDLRDRDSSRTDLNGGHWLRSDLKAFFNSQLKESNREWPFGKKIRFYADFFPRKVYHRFIKSLWNSIR